MFNIINSYQSSTNYLIGRNIESPETKQFGFSALLRGGGHNTVAPMPLIVCVWSTVNGLEMFVSGVLLMDWKCLCLEYC